jgi:hypothetical protein
VRLVFELLVTLSRFCRQRTELGTWRPVVTWKVPHHTWGGWERRELSLETQDQNHPPIPRQGRAAHCEGRQQWLCELGLEGVQQLFGVGVVEGQEAWRGDRVTEMLCEKCNEDQGRGLGTGGEWAQAAAYLTSPWWKSQCTPRQSGTGASSTLTLLACLAVKLTCSQLLTCRHQDAAVLPSCSKRPRLRYATPTPKALLSGS